MIDTGASRTALTRDVACGILGYEDIIKDTKPIMTAAGFMYFDMVKISRIELGGEFAFTDFNINLLDWKNVAVHGVVGMDVLAKLHIHSDTKTFAIQNVPFDIAKTA